MRESRSRPSWSVPSGYARDGASLSRPKLVLVYGKGARKSAKIAIRHKSTTTTPPATARRLRRSRRAPSRQRLDDRGRASGLVTVPARRSPSSLVADAGVEDAIEEIDDEVHDGQENAVGQDDGHDHRVVAPGHRQDEETPHPRNAKDRLDEKRPGAHRREHRAKQGHDGNECVLQRVLEDDWHFTKPFGSRGERVVGADDLKHAGAGEARD